MKSFVVHIERAAKSGAAAPHDAALHAGYEEATRFE